MKTFEQAKSAVARLVRTSLLALALVLVTGRLLEAQPPVVKKWDTTVGGGKADQLYAQLATADGGFLLGGYSYSGAGNDKTENSKGGADYWVVRLDASGTKVWDKTLGGTSDDQLMAMVATADGGVLLGGSSSSNAGGDKTENARGGYDYWVVKIDANGNKVWDKTLGGGSFDRLSSMVASADGGFLLGGFSLSGAGGDKAENSKGGADYWVVRLDASGNKIWDKTLGGSDTDQLSSIVATADGNFLLGGTSNSNPGGDKSDYRKGGTDYWVIKIDANGSKVWDKTLGGSDNDQLSSVVTSADGGFLLGGSSLSDAGGDKAANRKGGADYWGVKIDDRGNKIWDKTLGGDDLDQLSSVVASTDGGFLLGGFSLSGAGGDKAENSRGGADYWVVRLDASGTKVWDKTLGGTSDDQLMAMAATADGNFLLGGYSASNAGVDKSQNSRGDADYWVVRLLECRQFTASLTASGQLSCANPIVTLTATPSPGATYAFSQGATQLGGGNTATVTQPGTYSVSVTSAYGCVAGGAVSVSSTAPPVGTIRFVKPGATGSGASWDCATGDLQAAINSAAPGQQVWVAAGTYQPAVGQYFSMKEGVKIYGGFAPSGNPTSVADRNWRQYVTTLQGNGTNVMRNQQNSLTNAALLDGFTLTGGSALTGGGMYNNEAYPLINHCVFRANQASQWGGGIYNAGAGTTTLANCLFYQNAAQSGGAAFSNTSASPRFINVTIVDNTASENGGAVHSFQSAATELINAIVWGNHQAAASGQLFSLGSSLTRAYSSLLEGGESAIIGDHIVQEVWSQDPQFVDGSQGDYRLGSCSPAINQGNAALIDGGLLTDLAANSRIYGGMVDLGAYEVQAPGGGPIVSLSVSGVISCTNPTVTLTASPTSGFTYVFSSGATQLGGGNTATVSQPGTYSVSVSSPNGCSASAALSVSATTQDCPSPTPVASINSQPLPAGSATGIISLSAGSGGYTPNTPVSVSYLTPTGTTALYTGSTTDAGEILISGLRAGSYGPFVVSLNGGQASAPSNVVTLVDLTPDLTPLLYARPSTLYGTSALSVVIDLVNLSATPSQGLITLKISRDAKVSLGFRADATQVGSHRVQNGQWQFSDADPHYYVLTTSQLIGGGGVLSVGLEGMLNPGGTAGALTVSAVMLGGGDSQPANNGNANKLDYFQN